jgi:hypothetical protein
LLGLTRQNDAGQDFAFVKNAFLLECRFGDAVRERGRRVGKIAVAHCGVADHAGALRGVALV